MTSDIKTFNYYGMDKVNAQQLLTSFKTLAEDLVNMKIAPATSP